MSIAINNALSGLDAASKRLANSSNNIANQFSTTSIVNGKELNQPYQPTEVQQTSLQNGGVKSVTVNKEPATVQVYDPTNTQANQDGLVSLPNVDTAQELVNLQIASYDYKANLKTIQTENKVQQKLLDIIS